ncbi:DUF7822 domain-containing protein [Sphingomonas sp. ASY06-1R]|jgi:hypothetical protein|uniref:DUF7822 domain-containing protein n=1 Tax=Sphingomonas sp. ASY06-1R TaxID=3445771 RepID=UPI003FA29B9A
MANRAYLFATDIVPGSAPADTIGLSEWPYAIPLSYAILVSGETAQCPSTIWEDAMAFVGDYDAGLARLKSFLGKVQAPAAQPLIEETLAFLGSDANRRKYILLEVQEVFEMDDDPDAQVAAFADGLETLDDDIAAELAALPSGSPTAAPGLFTRLFGQKSAASSPTDAGVVETVEEWGLGAWSSHLYYS